MGSKNLETLSYRIIAGMRSAGKNPETMTDRELLAEKGVGIRVFCQIREILNKEKQPESKVKKGGFWESLRNLFQPKPVPCATTPSFPESCGSKG